MSITQLVVDRLRNKNNVLRTALRDLNDKMEEAKLTPEDTLHCQEYIDGHNHALERMQLHILNTLNATTPCVHTKNKTPPNEP